MDNEPFVGTGREPTGTFPAVSELSDRDLLARLLADRRHGRSHRERADRVLEYAGGVHGLARLGATALTERCGIPPGLANRLRCAFELGRRGVAPTARSRTIQSVASVLTWTGPRLKQLEHEELWQLSLDGANLLLASRCVSRGGLHGCAVTPRDLLCPALRDGAAAMVLVHNHPSGDPHPSSEDLAMTCAVQDACKAVGLTLLDHVIVARNAHCSLRDLGVLAPERSP